MRPVVLAVLAAALMSGCLDGVDRHAEGLDAMAACRSAPPSEHVLYFGPGLRLQPTPSPAGFAAGNAFSSGFLTNDLKEWLSDPVFDGLWLVGNVTLDYWVRSTGTPAPLVLGGDPGEGYHFFNQFGSDRSLQPAYATEYSTVLPEAGAVDHYIETLTLATGGFVVERGDRFRVLLTDLALDGPNGTGHDVLFGGDTPSQVRFTATCWPDVEWKVLGAIEHAISLPANQGLLTGAVPASQANSQLVPMRLADGVERLTITLEQTDDRNPVKDDVDIELLDATGAVVYGIGSPYSDESGTLWLDNLAVFPGGRVTVKVNSYSGVAYTGLLTVRSDTVQG